MQVILSVHIRSRSIQIFSVSFFKDVEPALTEKLTGIEKRVGFSGLDHNFSG